DHPILVRNTVLLLGVNITNPRIGNGILIIEQIENLQSYRKFSEVFKQACSVFNFRIRRINKYIRKSYIGTSVIFQPVLIYIRVSIRRRTSRKSCIVNQIQIYFYVRNIGHIVLKKRSEL